MLKIGMFSKLSRISIRMLRYYDDQGLLSPVQTDPFTGYRHYSEDQLRTAEQIAALRRMGFSLAGVKTLLAAENDRDVWEKALEGQRLILWEEEREARARLLLLENTLDQLRKDEKPMEYPVTIKELPERCVASVRRRIANYWHEQELWTTLAEETSGMNLQTCDPCYAMAVFHDKEHVEENPDVEIQMAVMGSYPDTANVKFKTVPAMRIASSTFKGAYEQTPEVTQAVAKWVRDNGYEFDGPSFFIYHVSPHETKNPEEYVTEVCFMVRKK
ncbi:MAG: MerR family transcriptional regulator [Oscillibacter sp.]|nr:MerR family transcriptional regulator [Oscillibacter sp.]MBD5154712.1 MerR family transcriptional regulator [Oscillibacter sp.]